VRAEFQDEITRHYDIGHSSGEQLLDEAMPHGMRPVRLARIAQGFGEAFRHEVWFPRFDHQDSGSMKPSGLRWVIGEAEVTKVDERQIEFTVRATEGAKEVGAGSHSRVVIDVANSSGGSAEQCFEDGGLPGHGLWLSLDGENRYF
jgi:hypothetical protein